jgi:hypothetical protein
VSGRYGSGPICAEGAFVLDAIKHLLAVHFDRLRCVDAEFDLAALLGEDFDADVSPIRRASPMRRVSMSMIIRPG